MDIRTKFVFTLVVVSLATLSALGLGSYWSAEEKLQTATLEQLRSVVELKRAAVEGIVDAWHDRVQLVASRTQLRLNLRQYIATGDPEPAADIQTILDDALSASPSLRQLWIHDLDGNLVAVAGAAAGSVAAEPEVVSHEVGATNSAYGGVAFVGGGTPLVSMYSPMVLDGETVGYLHAVLSAEELIKVSTNYQGLGKTGETMVVALDRDRIARVLHRVRNAPQLGEPTDSSVFVGGLDAGLVLASDGPGDRAARGEQGEFMGELVDYRGALVWAATRAIEETRWGVVVKIDDTEETAPIAELRSELTEMGLTFAAFAIAFGIFLGIRAAQPILVLSEAANELRAGRLDTRVDVQREDEIGLLALTFNDMAAELESQVELLREFRFFFDVSIDMMCIASVDGYFKRLNEAFTLELGWSEDELLGKPFVEFVHPDDVDATINEVQKLAAGEPTIRFENRFLCRDGSYKQLRWNSFPDPKTGRLYAIARVRVPAGEAT